MNTWSRPVAIIAFVFIVVLMVGSSSTLAVQARNSVQQGCPPEYIVQRGEWLASIARKCGVTLQAVLDANTDLANPNLVFPGQVINLPVGDQGISVTGTAQATEQPFFQGTQTVGGQQTGQQIITVQLGDTLAELAARYGVSLEDLVVANPDLIIPGDTLIIPALQDQQNIPTQQMTGQPTQQVTEQPTQQFAGQPTGQATQGVAAQPTEQPSDQVFPTATNEYFGEMQP